MTSVTAFVDGDLSNDLINLIIPDQGKREEDKEKGNHMGIVVVSDGVCAICLDAIELQETALIKGCEHAYCVNCILQWATYHEHPKCPQCKNPFESLSVHRSLDGSLHDYMLEESVCLLVRASWFKPLVVEPQDDFYDDFDEIFYYQYQYQIEYENLEDEDLEDAYFNTPSLCIGNRRWGHNGYVRAGRQEARPVLRSNPQNVNACSSRQRKQKEVQRESDAGSSHSPKQKEVGKDLMGRRAKRAQKREAADKAAAAKHQQHLVRLGRLPVSDVGVEENHTSL
ncbi:uncharacterized protein LOC130817433 [Amaranthus tricolor]|uniref:uncharacterized protein LOC130817433 n=1 Tax=Amaranthus tricolor TaxID=29722 RepID=UPI00258ED77B|nr:uncharacterized protein LOC130817433 [Amaranthus tricolor]